MSMPKFHQTFYAILRALEHGREQKTADLPDQIVAMGLINLSQAELSEKTNSGDNRFHDRVWWGATYLKQGRFIERPNRGTIQITQKGLDFLKNGPGEMTLEWLKKDKDYAAYVPIRSKQSNKLVANTEDLSPDDLLEKGFIELEESLKRELLEKLYQINPYYFEKLVLVLFQKMGYGDFEETSKSRDGGIDGIINQDQLGIEKIYIQAKRYAAGSRVREPEIRNFIGAMSGDVRKGIFVTTAAFDAAAIQKAKDASHTIVLIDGNLLVSLMVKHNIGVQTKNTYEIKSVDEDFFEIG